MGRYKSEQVGKRWLGVLGGRFGINRSLVKLIGSNVLVKAGWVQ